MEATSHQWVPWLPLNQSALLWVMTVVDPDTAWRTGKRAALFLTMILDLPVGLLDPVLSNLAAPEGRGSKEE